MTGSATFCHVRPHAPRAAIGLLLGLMFVAGAGAEDMIAHPHDPQAFTQGLVYADGVLFESTGRRGHSGVRRVAIESGETLAQSRLPDHLFGEGLALVGDRLVQLTWKAGIGFVYDADNLERVERFRYDGEGWGLASDGERLAMSDGTAEIRFLDPDTFVPRARIAVTRHGTRIRGLNELEFVHGELWANVWPHDYIARIDPDTGDVVGVVDARTLRRRLPTNAEVDVLNGIAFDPENGRLFLTGKLWPMLFEMRLSSVGAARAGKKQK